MYKIKEIFKNWKSGQGVFGTMSSITGVTLPWSTDVPSLDLDINFHGNYEDRWISPLLEKFLTENETTHVMELTSQNAILLLKSIYSKYIKNWTKQYATLGFQYNPIENYSMTESGTDGTTFNKSNSNNKSSSSSTTTSATQQQDVYGFNSSESVPSSKGDGNSSTSVSGTDNASGNESGYDSKQHSLTRSGNIGVTTSQQMIQAERELWMWNYFEEVVYQDLLTELTLYAY